MATSGERKALWFLAIVALSGSAVRVCRPAGADSSPALDVQLRRVDSARDVRAARTARAPGPRPDARAARTPARTPAESVHSPLDLDRADAREIERLPGVGPGIAARIVANRDSAGTFGGLDALCDVRGIGPSLAARLRPLVTFSGPSRPVSVACDSASKLSRKGRAARH